MCNARKGTVGMTRVSARGNHDGYQTILQKVLNSLNVISSCTLLHLQSICFSNSFSAISFSQARFRPYNQHSSPKQAVMQFCLIRALYTNNATSFDIARMTLAPAHCTRNFHTACTTVLLCRNFFDTHVCTHHHYRRKHPQPR